MSINDLEPIIAAIRPTVQKAVALLPVPLIEQTITLLGQECYTHLLQEFDLINHPECAKLAVSKVLSLAIVSFSGIVKVPQIIKLLLSGSVEGISFTSYALETISQLISAAYSAQKDLPFTTYGETVFIAVQNVIISTLVLNFSGKVGSAAAWLGLVAVSVATLLSKDLVPAHLFNALQAGAGILSIASKLPQIWTIYSQGTTGQLSAITVFSYLFGTFSRIFTTLQEVNDPLILWGFIASAALNVIIALQMVYYWNAPSAGSATHAKIANKSGSGKTAPSQSRAQQAQIAADSLSPSAIPGSGKSSGATTPRLRRRRAD